MGNNHDNKSQVSSLLSRMRGLAIDAHKGQGINALEDFKELEDKYLALVNEIDQLAAKVTEK